MSPARRPRWVVPFLDYLRWQEGHISRAAELAKVHRSLVYRYLQRSAWFRAELEAVFRLIRADRLVEGSLGRLSMEKALRRVDEFERRWRDYEEASPEADAEPGSEEPDPGSTK